MCITRYQQKDFPTLRYNRIMKQGKFKAYYITAHTQRHKKWNTTH